VRVKAVLAAVLGLGVPAFAQDLPDARACQRARGQTDLQSGVFTRYRELLARYRAREREAAVEALLEWPPACMDAAMAALRFAYSLHRGGRTCDEACLRAAVVLQTEVTVARRQALRRHDDDDLDAARRLLALQKPADAFAMRWHVLAGALLAEALRYPDALRALEEARRAGPDSVLPLVAMAALFEESALNGIPTDKGPDTKHRTPVSPRVRQARRAEELLREALRREAGNEEARLRLGFARLLGGDEEQASRELLRVLEEGSHSTHLSNARLLLGSLLEARGRTGEAMAHYRGVALGLPDQRSARLALGSALLRAGGRAGAQAAVRAALSVESSDRDVWIRFRASHSVRAPEMLALLRESVEP
jgi:tetratricopeptide (TPR) repeat protein